MIKHTIQLSKNECGIACLKMFYDYFDVECSYGELLDKVKIEEKGVSIEEMLKHLNKLANFEAYQIKKEELKNYYPAIILLTKKNKNHYVFIYKYEDGYFYISDPNKGNIEKIKEEKLLKYFSSYIIYNQKRDIKISLNNNPKVKYGAFKIPYLIFSLLEVFLVTYSMFYIFSINDFTFIKIITFLKILFINCFISLMKNICLNIIQKNIDENLIDSKIKNDFIKGKINNINALKNNIQEGYRIKNNLIKNLCIIIPNIFILIGSLVYIFFINKLLFIYQFIIYIIFFIFNIYFSNKKNNKLQLAGEIEMHLLKYENKILTKNIKEDILIELEKIKKETSNINTLTQTYGLVNFALKQFFLMSLLIFMYLYKIEIYSIFVITFYFYSLDGLYELSDFIVTYRINKILSDKFINE